MLNRLFLLGDEQFDFNILALPGVAFWLPRFYRVNMTDRERFNYLSWQIMEHKARYYIFNKPIIQDYEYDKMEREYDDLAKKLNVAPSASDMIGFDESRPSCQLVLKRLAHLYKRKRSKK